MVLSGASIRTPSVIDSLARRSSLTVSVPAPALVRLRPGPVSGSVIARLLSRGCDGDQRVIGQGDRGGDHVAAAGDFDLGVAVGCIELDGILAGDGISVGVVEHDAGPP